MYNMYEDERDTRAFEEKPDDLMKADISKEMMEMLNSLMLGSSAVTMNFSH